MKTALFFMVALTIVLAAGCGSNDGAHQYTSVLEGTTIQVPAMTGGQIIEMFIETGQQVGAGDRLIQIDSLELFLQYQQLSAAHEEVSGQKRVALTGLERARRDEAYVKQKYERIETLYHASSVPKQDYDDVSNQLSQAGAARETAAENLLTLTARLKQIDAQLALTRKKLNDTNILAPISGIITTRYFEPGEAVAPLRPVAEIMDITRLEAKIYIEETMLPHVRPGQVVTVDIDGVEQSFSGRISWISPRAEFTPKSILTPDTRTALVYAVEIDIQNPDGIMKDGMPAVITL